MEAILESYSAITNALTQLYSDVSRKGYIRLHANNLLQKKEQIRICVYAAFLNQRARSFSQGQQSGQIVQFTCGFSKRN